MVNTVEKFGQSAGKVWNTLNKYGALTESTLKKNTRLNDKEFYAAIGWLARENKISKTGLKYQLSETNLTEKIGNAAGKVYNVLVNHGEVDLTYISRITRITTNDAYSALGWLAREDKIYTVDDITNNDQFKIKLK
jgi:Winged helix-turn-helix domain (DUF2582)